MEHVAFVRVEHEELSPEARFGLRVRVIRQARSWSQEQLAQQLSEKGHPMHQTTVAKLEGGGRPTSVGEVVALAQIFGVQIEELFESSVARMHADGGTLEEQLATADLEIEVLQKDLKSCQVELASAEASANQLRQKVVAIQYRLGEVFMRRERIAEQAGKADGEH